MFDRNPESLTIIHVPVNLTIDQCGGGNAIVNATYDDKSREQRGTSTWYKLLRERKTTKSRSIELSGASFAYLLLLYFSRVLSTNRRFVIVRYV